MGQSKQAQLRINKVLENIHNMQLLFFLLVKNFIFKELPHVSICYTTMPLLYVTKPKTNVQLCRPL